MINCLTNINDSMCLNQWYTESVYPIKDDERQELLSFDRYVNGDIMQYTHLYVIYNFDNNLYKIGITTNIHARFRQLKTQSGCKLHLLFNVSFECAYDEKMGIAESKLHEYFKPKRKTGEWFNLSAKDLVKIRRWADINLELEYHPLKKENHDRLR